jgi:DNA-directed RNA polymerase subunit beta'
MEEKITVEELKKILLYISQGHKVPKIIHDVVFKVAKKEVEDKNKVVLIKRDPNIERNRIQSTFVKIIEGETMEIHPSIIKGFNADFDGDTMAIYLPVSEEAQKEAKEKMLSVVTNESINAPNFEIANQCIIGLYTLTYEEKEGKYKKINSVEDAEKLHIATRVEYKGNKTTAGRVIFNSVLPNYIDFINKPTNKKDVNKLLSDIIGHSKKDFAQTLDKLMKIGFEYSTKYPRTVDLEMLQINPKLEKLKIKLQEEKDPSKQQDIIEEMETELLEHLKQKSPQLYIIVSSGASKGISQLRQVMVAKGLIADAEGNLLPPISRSMNEGYTPQDYFDASKGSRNGIANRSHNTAYGGYGYRKAIFAFGNAECNINNGNCGTKKTFNIKLTPDLFKRMNGRYIQTEDGKIKHVDKNMINKIIPLRSPIYCRTREICRTCYGDLIKQLGSKNCGIIAAQEVASLSERIMKCNSGLIQNDNKMYTFEDLWERF